MIKPVSVNVEVLPSSIMLLPAIISNYCTRLQKSGTLGLYILKAVIVKALNLNPLCPNCEVQTGRLEEI